MQVAPMRRSVIKRVRTWMVLPSVFLAIQLCGRLGIPADGSVSHYAGVAQPAVKPAFLPLPPGAVEPQGWLRDWALSARDGITGHLDEMHPTFRDAWKGVPIEASSYLDPKDKSVGWPLEQCAYWLDGALRLGYALHDDALIARVAKRLSPIIDGVNGNGTSLIYWREGKPQGVFNSWAHSHMGRALVAWYMATGDSRILNALEKVYRDYPSPQGHREFQADISGLCNIDAMLETYRWSGDSRVLKCARAAMADPEVEKTIMQWCDGRFITGHAVCAYEQIRLPILLYPWTNDPKFRAASCKAWDNFRDNHMLPYGVTSGEEWLSGIGAFRLTETCDVAAHLWSASWMYRILGERAFGDSMERAFFNAAPGPIARDFKSMAYLQSPNRLKPDRLPVGWNRDCLRYTPLGNPAVLCCVGAVNRIIPTYVSQMWMATYDGGLAATLYGPNTVSAIVGDNSPVKISCKTAYPFEETIDISVDTDQDAKFPLYFRLPGWCTQPKISINGSNVDGTPSGSGFARIERTWKRGDTVSLSLPMTVDVACGYEREYPESSRSYFNGRPGTNFEKRRLPFETVSYGPLLFALPIPDIDPNTPVANAKWQYALNNDARQAGRDILLERKPMPAHWDWPLDAPLVLKVAAQEFDWQPSESQSLPADPVQGTQSTEIRLIPYGCTKFRISMFPLTANALKQREDQRQSTP